MADIQEFFDRAIEGMSARELAAFEKRADEIIAKAKARAILQPSSLTGTVNQVGRLLSASTWATGKAPKTGNCG